MYVGIDIIIISFIIIFIIIIITNFLIFQYTNTKLIKDLKKNYREKLVEFEYVRKILPVCGITFLARGGDNNVPGN